MDGRKNFIGPRDLHVLLDLAKAGQAQQVETALQHEAEKNQRWNVTEQNAQS